MTIPYDGLGVLPPGVTRRTTKLMTRAESSVQPYGGLALDNGETVKVWLDGDTIHVGCVTITRAAWVALKLTVQQLDATR